MYAFTRGLRSILLLLRANKTDIEDNSGSKWCTHECKLTLQLDNLVVSNVHMSGVVAAPRNKKLFAWPHTINKNNIIVKSEEGEEKQRASVIENTQTSIKNSMKMINLAKNVLKAT